MRVLAKAIGVMSIVAVLLFLLAAKFSVVESRYACAGEATRNGQPRPTTVYLKVDEYRWWVGLWNDSDASILLEVPNEWFEHYSRVDDDGDRLTFYDGGQPKGLWSKLSGALTLDIPTVGIFAGTCKAL